MVQKFKQGRIASLGSFADSVAILTAWKSLFLGFVWLVTKHSRIMHCSWWQLQFCWMWMWSHVSVCCNWSYR